MNKLRLSWPNRITLGRILLIAPFVIVMLHVNNPSYTPWARYGAMVIFAIMAISDAVDGWLARRTHDITQLGTFLDPLADKLLITCACLLLCSNRSAIGDMKLPYMIVVIIIGKDLYITGGFIILYMVTSERKIVPMRAGKLCTLLQLSMVIAILISPDVMPYVSGYPYFVKALWWSATVMAVLTVITYTRAGTRFLNEYEHQKKQELQN